MLHTEAATLFATARNKWNGKPIGNNTRLHRLIMEDANGVQEEEYSICLHHTNVVIVHADGTYTLNSGGWQTVTTKARMNEHSPAHVFQRKGKWYLMPSRLENFPGESYGIGYPDRDATPIPFHDGIRVDSMGNPIS